MCSASDVKPTRSANSTVTMRRSSACDCTLDCGDPQAGQNRAPTGTGLPQVEQSINLGA